MEQHNTLVTNGVTVTMPEAIETLTVRRRFPWPSDVPVLDEPCIDPRFASRVQSVGYTIEFEYHAREPRPRVYVAILMSEGFVNQSSYEELCTLIGTPHVQVSMRQMAHMIAACCTEAMSTATEHRYPSKVHMYRKADRADATGMVWEYAPIPHACNVTLLELVDNDPWQGEHTSVAKISMNLWDDDEASRHVCWHRADQFMAVLGYTPTGTVLSWDAFCGKEAR